MSARKATSTQKTPSNRMPLELIPAGSGDIILLDDDSLPAAPREAVPAAAATTPIAAANDPQRQIMRVLLDLKTMIRQRSQVLRQLERQHRDALQRLTRVAARFEHGGLAHCLRVGAVSALLADALGKPLRWCDMLFDAAPVHDLGNLDVPHDIVHKHGRLSGAQWALVRQHPLAGARLLGNAGDPLHELAAEIALNHHEKWDGSGYPARRLRTNIPLPARIVAIADFVDALSHDAPHHPALAEAHVFELLELASGAQFDPDVVMAMHGLRPLLRAIDTQAAEHARAAERSGTWPQWWRELRSGPREAQV